MKKFLIAAGALVMMVGVSQAQTTDSKDTKDKQSVQRKRGEFPRSNGFGKDLNLSADQQKQFKEINESYRKQVTDIRNDKTLSAADAKTKIQSLRKEQVSKTQALLTPEQKTKMAERRKAFTKDGKGKTAMRGQKGVERMKTKLGLTDEQSSKIKTNQQAFHEKAKAIRSDNSLTDEQKKEQVKNLAKQNHESMKSILTPDQLEKMKSGRKNRNGSK